MQRKDYAKKIKFPDGSRLRIGIVASDFNKDITESMLAGALQTLAACKVKKSNTHVIKVPGSFEIPFGCLALLKKKKYHAIIALGCVMKGETNHDFYIASAASRGIMNLSLEYHVPVSFGIITTNNLAQAKIRSTGETNKGNEAALTAVTMALLK